MSLHAITDLTNGDVDIDPNNVAFIGQSLGAITGIPALAVANAPLTESALLGEALPETLSNANALFSVRSAVLSVPGGGIGVSGFDSPGFRDRSRGAILAVASDTSPSFAGTPPLASFMGLPDVSSTSAGSGLVRFQSGGHSSLLNPFINAAATAEMQRQALLFIASEGEAIVISDNTVIAN